MSPDPFHDMNRLLGQLSADVANLKDDQKEERAIASAYRLEARAEFRELREQVADLKETVTPAVEKVAEHSQKLKDHDDAHAEHTLFRKKIGGLLAFGSLLISTTAGGIWWLLSTYWDWIVSLVLTLIRPKAG